MFFSASNSLALTGVLLLGAVVPCFGQSGVSPADADKDRQIRRLQRELARSKAQYHSVAGALAASKKREAELSKTVNELRLRFEALGDNLLNGGQDALLEAVKNAEVIDKRKQALEVAVENLMADLREYLRTAVASDPDARLRLETSIRGLDVARGLRQNPRPQIALGSLQHAKVISIDAESGLLVVNAGEAQAARRGMSFEILRGNRKVADATIADVRKDFSGLLITSMVNTKDKVRLGDIASVKVEN